MQFWQDLRKTTEANELSTYILFTEITPVTEAAYAKAFEADLYNIYPTLTE